MPDDFDKADADASPNSVAAEDQQEASRFFEFVEDPYKNLFPDSFGRGKKISGMEQSCGDACLLKGSLTRSGDSSTETSASAELSRRSHLGVLQQPDALPHSRLEGIVDRLSESASGSTSQAAGRLKGMKKVEPGTLAPADQRRSAR